MPAQEPGGVYEQHGGFGHGVTLAAIVDILLGEIGAAFRAGMAGPGPVDQRIGAALAGQYLALAKALEGSPHAAELMSEHKRTALALEDIEHGFSGEIATALAAEGVGDAVALAHLPAMLRACKRRSGFSVGA